MKEETVYAMKFAKVYPLLVNKAVKKGRRQEEVDFLIAWLTGYSPEAIAEAAAGEISYGDFFRQAPQWNPNWAGITGTVCGVRVETVQPELMRKIRCLDKLIDQLAKGKSPEAIVGRIRGKEGKYHEK